MSLKDNFEAAAADVRTLTKKPNNDELLQLYGLYKQATVGDNNTSQPWAIQLESRAKWDAWNNNKGMSQDSAMEDYIKLVQQLKVTYA